MNTKLPRWSRDPARGHAEHRARISDELVTALRRMSSKLAIPLGSLLLTAHAKVISALSGEPDVSIGYATERCRRPLPRRLTTAPSSWRTMLQEIDRAVSEAISPADVAVDDLMRERGQARPLFETVFDLVDDDPVDVQDETVMRVSIVERDGLEWRLRYSTDAIDEECAARIAGYHCAALALMAGDLDADHHRQTLVSPEEVVLQLDGFAGRQRQLPDRRVHELFEERVRAHPAAIAAIHGEAGWTYRQLNGRANRLARALLKLGLPREGVVAVATERTLGWMASVLAIFKAGGVYLPVEPHLPAERVTRMLSRAGCRVILTEGGSMMTLRAMRDSLPKVQVLDIEAIDDTRDRDGDLGLDVAAGQLAYIYFTSGSTGEPKGAMIEHAGMLNHMLAKIEDHEIVEGTVVAQSAPQSFDISLWQLLSAVLVGGRTLIVGHDAIFDAGRFIDTLVQHRVNVAQVVPSYLDVLIAYLTQHPRALPDLRYLSVTGEPLKKELVERWFAAQPGIALVNAYGLTETSDDTNHEIMTRVPERERVPLGPPVTNVRVYVVDEHLSLVPLGAPGEIVFSGVCVGRGYVNDPERTERAYTVDPYRREERLYRSGDYGRWLPEGKLDYLGRRDTQVKISGFRIEIGEIENTLLRLAGIRDAAVVVATQPDGHQRLVAFYSGRQPIETGLLRDALSASLPEYMVPSVFHWRTKLALTPNGKIDKKALTALAQELDRDGQEHDSPATATEKRLADAWADVLGLPTDQIGRQDHFFDLGGTSLSALKLVIALDRAVSVADLAAHPRLASLATFIDHREASHVTTGPQYSC